jgi:YD repeat-containing protein
MTSQVDTYTISGRVHTITYDVAAGTWTQVTPEARQRALTTDGLGRVVQVAEPDQDLVSYSYTPGGRPLELTTGSGPAERSVTFAYDANGFFVGHTDPLGRTTQVTLHDPVGRYREIELPGARTIELTYDPRGHVSTIVTPNGETHGFVFDQAGHLVQHTEPDAGAGAPVTQYVYDSDRLLAEIQYPGGDSATIDRDSAGRIIGFDLPTRSVTTTYDPSNGQVSGHGVDGETLSYTYDGELLDSETWAGTIDGTVDRTYDTSFRLATLVVAGQAFAYTYDDDDR